MQTTLDFKAWLKSEWVKRAEYNPRYSLRAFARDISWAPSTLSEVMSGKKGVSVGTAVETARILGGSEIEIENIKNLAKRDFSKSEIDRANATHELKNLKSAWKKAEILQDDTFSLLSDPNYFLCLELLRAKICKNTLELSHEMGITHSATTEIIEKFIRLKMIKKTKDAYQILSDTLLSSDETPSVAIKNFHRIVLSKALKSLEQDPVEERDFMSFIMAIRSKDIPKLKRDIRVFLNDANEKYSTHPRLKNSLDEVISLSTQLVPYVKSKNRKKTNL